MPCAGPAIVVTKLRSCFYWQLVGLLLIYSTRMDCNPIRFSSIRQHALMRRQEDWSVRFRFSLERVGYFHCRVDATTTIESAAGWSHVRESAMFEVTRALRPVAAHFTRGVLFLRELRMNGQTTAGRTDVREATVLKVTVALLPVLAYFLLVAASEAGEWHARHGVVHHHWVEGSHVHHQWWVVRRRHRLANAIEEIVHLTRVFVLAVVPVETLAHCKVRAHLLLRRNWVNPLARVTMVTSSSSIVRTQFRIRIQLRAASFGRMKPFTVC